MSQGKLRVARQLVRDHFGPVTEAVAWTLLTKGRQTAGALVGMLAAPAGFVPLKRKLELSGVPIPPRNVREALFVLIQHNLATFAETSDNPNRPPVVYYSMSLEDVLARLRIPSIVVYVSERVSELAGAVIRTVFAHGRMSLEHLQSAAESDPSMSEYDPQEIRKAFNVLAHRGYLCRVNEESGVTTSDMKIKNENEALEEMGPIPRTKERAEALRRANEKTKQQSETHTNLSMVGSGTGTRIWTAISPKSIRRNGKPRTITVHQRRKSNE